MNFLGITAANKTNTEILQKVRVEQKSIYALEHMLGYHIKEIEELRPHKENIEFTAKSDYAENPDLVDLSYWIERIENIEKSIKKNEKMITRLYNRLYSRIIFKIIEGEELSMLDLFFYNSKKYIQKVKSGDITFRELVENYNWETQKFEGLE